jgi:hypothetical protein
MDPVDLCSGALSGIDPVDVRSIFYDRGKKALFFYDSERTLVGYIFYLLEPAKYAQIHLLCANKNSEYESLDVLILVTFLLSSWSKGYRLFSVSGSHDTSWYEKLGFQRTQNPLSITYELRISRRAQILGIITGCTGTTKRDIDIIQDMTGRTKWTTLSSSEKDRTLPLQKSSTGTLVRHNDPKSEVSTEDLTVREMRKILVGHPNLYRLSRRQLVSLLKK